MRAAALCLLSLAACSGYDDLALLEVDGIEPTAIEPGTKIRIHGSGFPLGRSPQITVRGTAYRPGKAAIAVRFPLAGQVRSDALIEVPITGAHFEALEGRATVDGTMRVGFGAADGTREIFAEEPVKLDFLPETAAQLRVAAARHDAGIETHADSFGVELSPEELGTPGVRVSSVRAGGLAALQGIEPGDTVLAVDDVSVYRRRDFVPNPTKSESMVLVSRDGLRGVHALLWPHDKTERIVEPAALGIFVLLGLLLGWGSPLVLSVRRDLDSPPAVLWVTRTSLLLLCAALVVSVPIFQWTAVWILVLGTTAALFALVVRDRSGLSSFALAIGATLTVMFLVRSASLAEVIAAQRPETLRWFAFQTPASTLAFVAYLCALGEVSRRWRVSASLFAAPCAVLGAVTFLGGWPLGSPVAAVAIVVAKAGILTVGAHAARLSVESAARVCVAGMVLATLGAVVDLTVLFPYWGALTIGLACSFGARAVVPPLRQAGAPSPV
jgi:hypothetical protein